jgi:hypothetical protein
VGIPFNKLQPSTKSGTIQETPGFCSYIEHTINVSPKTKDTIAPAGRAALKYLSPNFVPKRFKEYRIPEILKPEIWRQIDELLKNEFIRHSTSSMASPSGRGGLRLAIDFRYITSFCQGDALVLPHLSDAIQRVGASHYLSLADAQSGYWQLNIRESDRCLTAFLFEGCSYEWCRMPFGVKIAGNTFFVAWN